MDQYFIAGQRDRFHDPGRFRNDQLRFYFRCREGEFYNFALWSTLERNGIEVRTKGQSAFFYFALELGDLFPTLVGAINEMLEVAPISVGHGGHDVVRLDVRLKIHFCDLGKLFSDGIDVFRFRSSDLVKVDLLEEVSISRGSLSFARIAGIENALPIFGPGRAPAAGGILDMFDQIRQLFAGGRIEESEVTIFTSIFGKRNGDQGSIR